MEIILQNIRSCKLLSFALGIGSFPGQTFTNNQLIFRPSWVGQDIVRLDHGRSLPIRNGEVVRRLRRIPGGRWKYTGEVSISGSLVIAASLWKCLR